MVNADRIKAILRSQALILDEDEAEELNRFFKKVKEYEAIGTPEQIIHLLPGKETEE